MISTPPYPDHFRLTCEKCGGVNQCRCMAVVHAYNPPVIDTHICRSCKENKGVVGLLKKVLAEVLETQNLPAEPIGPKTAPTNKIIFSQELDDAVSLKYADQALQCPNFELFLKLIEQVANENQLRPEIDSTKIAGLLNRLRVQKGLLPL